MKSIGFTYRIPRNIMDRQNYRGFTYKSPITYLYLFTVYEIKSPPWTILWFRILGIFPVENIKRLCIFMFQTWDNSQLLRSVLWISAELTIVSSLKHKYTQPLYILNRVEKIWVNMSGVEKFLVWKFMVEKSGVEKLLLLLG